MHRHRYVKDTPISWTEGSCYHLTTDQKSCCLSIGVVFCLVSQVLE